MAPFLKSTDLFGNAATGFGAGLAGSALGGAASTLVLGGNKKASAFSDPSTFATPSQISAPTNQTTQITPPTFQMPDYTSDITNSFNAAGQMLAQQNALFQQQQQQADSEFAAAMEAQKKRLIEESRRTSGGFFGTSGRKALLGNA